jgi:hypothetical protein
MRIAPKHYEVRAVNTLLRYDDSDPRQTARDFRRDINRLETQTSHKDVFLMTQTV